VFSVSELCEKSRDFFDLCDVEIQGVSHTQGLLNLMGYPTDAIGENFKRRGLRVAAVFDRACDGDCVGVFLFHTINLSELCEKSTGFFNLPNLFFVDVPEVRARNPMSFDLVGSAFIEYAPHASIHPYEVGLSEMVVEFCCSVFVLNHVSSIPQPTQKARDFFAVMQIIFV